VRLRYFVGWIIGLIALIPGLYLLINIVVPRIAPTLSQFTDLFPLLVIWSILMFLLYLYLGDGSELHQDYLVPYQSIWTVLILILMGTILAGYSGYQQVSQRIEGELSALTLAQATTQHLYNSTHSLVDAVTDMAQKKNDNVDDYVSYVAIKLPEVRQYINSAALQSKDAQASLHEVITYFKQQKPDVVGPEGSSNRVTGIANIAVPALTPINNVTTTYTTTDYIKSEIDALSQIDSIFPSTIQGTKALTEATDHIQSILNLTQTLTSTKAYSLELFINSELLPLTHDVDMKANVADTAFSGIKLDGLPLFLWNGVFLAVLVLFPWLLLLLFLYRKRVNLAAQIYADLKRLDPYGGLLRRVLGGSSSRYERKVKEYLVNGSPRASDRPASRSSIKTKANPGQAGLVDPEGSSSDKPHRNEESKDQSENELIELLAARTFSSFEYLISLIFLSLLIAAGWYYVFYPQTSIGLTNLIEHGAGVRQLTGFITANLTPLTMGFAGAYFFLMQMLVRRYLSDDLYPSAFLQAVQRLLLVFMLSLALTILTIRSPNDLFAGEIHLWEGLVITIAFLIGIYPTSGLQLIITLVNRKLKRTFFPPTLVPEPITKLSGVTIWIEARLLEENIESIEAMATAPIEQLVVGTHFPPAQIVDWIDQAILYLHSGHNGEWFSQLRAVGVRGASDLLDVTGLNLADPKASLYRESQDLKDWGDFVPNRSLLDNLVAAVTSANASGVPEPDPNDPRGMTRNNVDKLVRSADTAAKAAERVHDLVVMIDGNNPETFEYVRLINAGVENTKKFIATAAATSATMEQVKLSGDSDQEQQLHDTCVQLKNTAETAAKLTAQYVPITPSETSHPLKLAHPAQLDEMKIYVADLRHQLSEMQLEINNIIYLAGLLATGDSANASAQELQKQAMALLDQLEHALDDITTASDRLNRVTIAQPATLDAREDLKDATRNLQEQAALLRKQLAAVEDTLMAEDISKTHAQQETIKPALDDAKSAVDAVQQPAIQASMYAVNILLPSQLSPARQVSTKETVQEIKKLFKTAQNQIGVLSAAAGTITAPPQLTASILAEMCDAIWPAPNLAYILNFYQQSCEDVVEPQHSVLGKKVPIEV